MKKCCRNCGTVRDNPAAKGCRECGIRFDDIPQKVIDVRAEVAGSALGGNHDEIPLQEQATKIGRERLRGDELLWSVKRLFSNREAHRNAVETQQRREQIGREIYLEACAEKLRADVNRQLLREETRHMVDGLLEDVQYLDWRVETMRHPDGSPYSREAKRELGRMALEKIILTRYSRALQQFLSGHGAERDAQELARKIAQQLLNEEGE